MQKTLTIRYSTEEATKVVSRVFCVVLDSDDVSTINAFVSWIDSNNRGKLNATGDIDCESNNDYIACHKKALALKLLPQLSPSSIKSRFCYR